MLSRLRVNFQKCSIMGIGIDRIRVEGMASNLGGLIGSILFSFLGVKVGLLKNCNVERLCLVPKMKVKLRLWEDKKISLGGRITLLKAVLSLIPIYQLSFHKITKKNLESAYFLTEKFSMGERKQTMCCLVKVEESLRFKKICRDLGFGI